MLSTTRQILEGIRFVSSKMLYVEHQELYVMSHNSFTCYNSCSYNIVTSSLQSIDPHSWEQDVPIESDVGIKISSPYSRTLFPFSFTYYLTLIAYILNEFSAITVI
jgi:hypothetical protein